MQPAEAVVLAYRDVLKLAPEERPYARYAWISDDGAKAKRDIYLAVAGLANSLSSKRRIVAPLIVMADGLVMRGHQVKPEDWANAVLIRFRTLDYGWDTAVFDRLGDPSLEPIFHVWQYDSEAKKWYKALAPWLLSPLGLKDGEGKLYETATIGLSVETGYSPCPIVEATNFVWQAAIQFDRRAGYYDFLGVKALDDFNRLVGFEEKASLRFALPLLEAVAKSGVATQPRRVEIYEKIGGRYFATKDQVNQRGQAIRNPLLTLGRKDLKADATEIFASLPNGWWATGLFSLVDGSRQDSAPDGVGYHHGSVTNDGKIHINLTCLACHDAQPGKGGLQPFKPYFRNLFATPGPVAFAAKYKGLEEEYLTPIDVSGDQQRYVAAVWQATGLTPDKYAALLVEAFHRWDRPVDRPLAAFRAGVKEAEFVAALDRQLKTFGVIDNVNGNWLLEEARRSEIGVDQWSEAYNQAQLALRGYPQWPVALKKRYPVRR